MFYLLSEGTYGAMCESKTALGRCATLRVYGPVCDEEGRLYISRTLTPTGLTSKSRRHGLTPDEIQFLLAGLKEHVRIVDKDFPQKGSASAKQVCAILALPW